MYILFFKIQRSKLEDRYKFQEENLLEEEYKARNFLKLIENSKVRYNAIQTINIAYNKLIAILRHDELFYEPILSSLDKDIEDQNAFIKTILHIGTPAISTFRQLSEEYRVGLINYNIYATVFKNLF